MKLSKVLSKVSTVGPKLAIGSMAIAGMSTSNFKVAGCFAGLSALIMGSSFLAGKLSKRFSGANHEMDNS